MTYEDTLEYLYSQLPMFHRTGAAAYKANLDNTNAIMEFLDAPQKDFRSVHIAGTNGKGSVSHMLASLLQESGYKTGLYTSPHLKDFRERIRINGKMIEKNEVIKFVKKYKTEFDVVKPSFFEWTVGLAFDYFSRKSVDIAVIETGLGGRLDSTNVITPLVSVITNVQWDHMDLLGNTLKKIGIEKAGIIKKDVPVVIGSTQKETAALFRNIAKKKHALINFADKNYRAIKSEEDFQISSKLVLNITKNKLPYLKNLELDLGGWYQLKNVCTVLQTAEILESKGFELNRKNIRRGMAAVKKNTGFAGRWEILGKNPFIVADTGHNADGVSEVLNQINSLTYHKLHIVFGMVNDKDITSVLKLLPVKAQYYFCKPDIPRGLDPKVLQLAAIGYGLKGKIFPSVEKALAAAKNNSWKNDLIYIGGSTFVVAEIV